MLKQLLAAIAILLAAVFGSHTSAPPAHTAQLHPHGTTSTASPQPPTTLAFSNVFHPNVTQPGAQHNSPPVKSANHSTNGLTKSTTAFAPSAISPTVSASSQAAAVGLVLGAQVSPTDPVTHSELDAALNTLRSQFFAITGSGPSFSGPAASTPATFQAVATAQNIDRLSGTTLTNVTVNGVSGLTASDIPSLLGSYFPATSTIAIAFGGTGTSTAPTANKVLLADSSGNWEYAATSSLGIGGGASTLSSLSDVLLSGPSFGNVLEYNGSKWANAATSSLGVALADTTGTLSVARGGTGTSTWQTGSIPYFNGTNFTENNSNLFWDNTNKRLGIATTSPFTTLSVTGNGFFSGTLTTGTTVLDPALGISGPNIPIDPVTSYHAAGTIATTTGSIAASSNLLTVANAAGWSIGQGLDVAGAGSGGADLITSVTNISGTTFTLGANAISSVSNAIVNHDDTAALNAAIASGRPVHLRKGNYNVTSQLTMSTPTSFVGDGVYSTIIWNRGTTNDVLRIKYEIAAGWTSPGGYNGNGAEVSDFQISQATGTTPIGGYGVHIESTDGAGFYVTGLSVSRLMMNDLWGGVKIGPGVISDWIADLNINSMVGGDGILVDSPAPSGDMHYNDIEMAGPNTHLTLNNTDVTTFTNLKTNGSSPGILFTNTATSNVKRVRFVNANIETAGSCGVTFSSAGARQVQFIGGGIGDVSAAFCNAANNVDFTVEGLNFYSFNDANAPTLYNFSSNQWLAGEITPDLNRIGSNPGFEAAGARGVMSVISTTAGNNSGYLMKSKSSGGTSRSAGVYFNAGKTTATSYIGLWHKAYRRVRLGGAYVEEELDLLVNNRGFLARILRPLFRLVTKSWHMVALGFLFGLGFDTATEIAMFGISAAQAAKGMSLLAIAVFPVLFGAGMMLVDTTDGVLMLGAYDWAFVKPIRKLYYNMTITLVSVLVAMLIGGIEALGLISDQFGLTGGLWDIVGSLNDNFNGLGFVIIGVFAAAWTLSYVIYRVKRLDDVEVRCA
jgi:HoxN/HupN/NixA family high-affinity nickel-transporter